MEAVEIILDNGLKVSGAIETFVDWCSVRTLFESGVSCADIAEHFKIEENAVEIHARREHWLRPQMVDKLRRKVGKRQMATYRRTGQIGDVVAIKAAIWEERGEKMKEEAYRVAKRALSSVTDERAGTLIEDAGDFARIVDVCRKISGEESKEDKAGPSLAVNIGFLRSSPRDVIDF